MLNTVASMNARFVRRLDGLWPLSARDNDWDYIARVVELSTSRLRITDVGAGRRTPFAGRITPTHEVIGVDVLEEDLNANSALTKRVVADVGANGLPDAVDGSDLICSCWVLEHLPDNRAFAREVHRCLTPGGATVHLFAARWSMFALANRMLPDEVSKRVLYALRPESREVGGFTTHYDATDPTSARRAFLDAGFERVDVALSWEVSQYFRWCLPLFVLARTWEEVASRFRIKRAASYVLLTGYKTAQ